jgi:indole-3-glycerol phosphate synthase
VNILEKLVEASLSRLAGDKAALPEKELIRRTAEIKLSGYEFAERLRQPGLSFICEVKRASPSKGVISEEFHYIDIARTYEAAGAAAISVLTETDYFLGSGSYLEQIAQVVKLPLLRKDFIVDPYQIYQSKLLGAKAVLLICSILDEKSLKEFISLSREIGLCALVEAHDEREVEMALSAGAGIIGVNNRDLKTFKVDINNSIRLRKLIPDDILSVAESGVKTAEDAALLAKNGIDAILIGEALMRSTDKAAALQGLMGI